VTLSVVTFKWKPRAGYRSVYGPAQVNTLRRMVARNYAQPHRFICVTDDPKGIDPEVEIVPLWDDHASVPNPSFRTGPSCYRRLKVFSRDMGAVLGERFVCMDLDVVITGDLTPLLDRPEPFVAWRNPNPKWPLNGSMFMLKAGTRPRVWDSFDPKSSPRRSHAAGCFGSDQGWMSYVLGSGESTWGPEDGVYSFQDEIVRRRSGLTKGLPPRRPPYPMPANARVVVFHGAVDPWMPAALKMAPWIEEHYR